MFESVSDWDLVEVMGESTRYESVAVAQRLAAVAELFVRRSGALAELDWCVVDNCAAVAAEVSAVQNISHARAVSQVQFACALRHRLPAVAKVFLRGTIDLRVVTTIINRTDNVEDEVMPALDAAIARHVEKWMKLSKNKVRDRVDAWVAKFDPAGVRVPPQVEDNRYVEIDPAEAGMAFVNGHVRAADGAAFSQRLDALAATVCEHDPRSRQQRRADACGALGRNEAILACGCAREDCPAAVQRRAAATAVIHVLAEQATLDGTGDAVGYLAGFGVLPAASVREVATHATLRPVVVPTDAAPEQGYRPSAPNVEFIRWRDLTCRWPGCDRPVEKSDLDHTVPWPLGATHPSNNKPYCRIHHLCKTFCGWTDQQMPDGTIILTSPTGHTYATEAHGSAMFPALGQSTGELDPLPMPQPSDTDRTAMMPRRTRTRDQQRRDRINHERRQRADLITEHQHQRQAWLAATYQPPPF